MASVSGPLMSMDASGSIGKTVTFSKWRGRQYVRQWARPSNPESEAQVFTRSMFGFAGHAWASLDPGVQATWNALAAGTNVPAFNAFMSYNMNLWKNILPPTQAYPPTVETPGTVTGLQLNSMVGQLSGEIELDTLEENWGIALLARLGVSPGSNPVYTRHIILATSATTYQFVIPRLAVGTWYVQAMPFATSGAFGVASAVENAAVN